VKSPKAQFDTQRLVEDMALKGWNKQGLARRARLSDMTVIRFLRGEQQTAKTAKKIAAALGHSIRRYLISTQALSA